MATITNRGTGTNGTGATTLVCAPTSTIAANSAGVLAIAFDNAGSAGSVTIGPVTVTDSVGNVWTERQNALYDNGAASAGIEFLILTCDRLATQLTSANNVTISWVGGVSVAAKAYSFTEITPGASLKMQYNTGGVGAASTGSGTIANPTVTTGTIPIGSVVLAGYFAEGVATVTADSDTTNGSWSAQQTATVGATTSGVRIATQAKVQTTTPSTQTYNVTVVSQDCITGWVQLDEVSTAIARTTGDSVSSLSDAAGRVVGHPRTSSDAVASLVDAISALKTLGRSIGDSVESVSDALARAAIGFTKTATDSLSSLSDAVTAGKFLPRAIADTVATATDALIRAAMAQARTDADAVGSLSDTVARAAISFTKTAADAVASITDAATRAGSTRIRSAADTAVSLTDALVRSAAAKARGAADTVGSLADALVRAASSRVRAVADLIAGDVGDLSIAAHGSPPPALVVCARFANADQHYYLIVDLDDSNAYGFGVGHIVERLLRLDAIHESGLTAAVVDLGLGVWLTEWQLRLEVWGDPSSVTVRGKAWRTGESQPDWTTGTDNYPLIPRSDATFAYNATIDSAARIDLAEGLSRTLASARIAADSIGSLADAVARSAIGFARTLADGITGTGSFLGSAFSNAFDTGSGGISESISRSLTSARSASESIPSLGEAIARSVAAVRNATDALPSIGDAASRLTAFARETADSIASVADAIGSMKILNRAASDVVSALSDVVSRAVAFVRREHRPND